MMHETPNQTSRGAFGALGRKRIGRVALVAAAAALLTGGVLQTTAGASSGPPYATNTTVTASPAAPVTGQSVTFTSTTLAVGAPSGIGKPKGQAVFTITGSDSSTVDCDGGDTVTLVKGVGSCTVSAGLLAALSPYTVSSAYTDTVDGNFSPGSGTLNQVVTPGPTTTSLISSQNPAVSSQPLTLTAAVATAAPGQGTLTGSVKFAGISQYAKCDGTTNNVVPVSGGQAVCSLPNGLPAATSPYAITATYGSDPNFAGSSASISQKVHRGAASVSLALTPDTCGGTNYCTTNEGTPLAFTVTATQLSPSTVVPSGPVVFSILPAGSTTSLLCDGGNTVTLTGGQGTCTLSNGVPAVVYYTVTATLEDPNYFPVSTSLYLNSALGSTNTTVYVQPTPGAGASFDVVATVTPVETSLIAPGGRVAISVCSNTTHVCQGTPIVVDSTTGEAILSVKGGEFPGAFTAYAHYLGDQNFYASTAPSRAFTVIKSETKILFTPSENPSVDGDAVNVTTVIKGLHGSSNSTLVGPPTGTLTYTVTGPSGNLTCQGGNVVKIRKGSNAQGAFTCYLPPGTLTDPAAPGGDTTYTISASYSGDSNFDASTNTYTQTVVPSVS
jgi:hypothetical protein